MRISDWSSDVCSSDLGQDELVFDGASFVLGGANVVLEFDAGFDADQALLDVREKVDLAKAELPEDAEEPTVHEINLSLFPVLTVSLSGPAPERTLLRIARDLQDRIEGIASPPVAEIIGDPDEHPEVFTD